MAITLPFASLKPLPPLLSTFQTRTFIFATSITQPTHSYPSLKTLNRAKLFPISNRLDHKSAHRNVQRDEEVHDLGVRVALSMLRFYKSEISPLLPRSCRYVPTCSEYSMEAYKKYGFVKGTVLTVVRVCRCNPMGGSGFDPPRWFDEDSPIPPDA